MNLYLSERSKLFFPFVDIKQVSSNHYSCWAVIATSINNKEYPLQYTVVIAVIAPIWETVILHCYIGIANAK